jgi:hypothetical protein
MNCLYCGHSSGAHQMSERQKATLYNPEEYERGCYFIQPNNEYCACDGFVESPPPKVIKGSYLSLD